MSTVKVTKTDLENQVVCLTINKGQMIASIIISAEGLIEATVFNGCKWVDISVEAIGTDELEIHIDGLRLSGL